MLSFQFNGQWVTRPVQLIGIDEKTYANVGDFSKYLLHEGNRKQIDFNLREKGYDERLKYAGWTYRRERVKYEQAYREQMEQMRVYETSGPRDPFHREAGRRGILGGVERRVRQGLIPRRSWLRRNT